MNELTAGWVWQSRMEEVPVLCATNEERLLLTLIDRIDTLEGVCHRVLERVTPPAKPDQNLLDSFHPEHAFLHLSEQDDAAFIRNMIVAASLKHDGVGPCIANSLVNHPSNLKRLQDNGFKTQKLMHNFYMITWPPRTA